MKLIHSRIQHGVGQGSFHSASIEATSRAGARYRYDYVYDCGGLVAGGKLSPAVGKCLKRFALERRVHGDKRAVLDLLVLSHLDQDHINGARHLVDKFKVRRIVMPYLGPVELALILLRAVPLTTAYIKALLKVAHGGGLWGVPVTQIRRGRRDDEGPDIDPDRQSEGREDEPAPLARDMPVAVGSDAKWPSILPDTDEARLQPQGCPVWRLRFWNRGLAPTLAADIAIALAAIGMPMAGLQSNATKAEMQALIAWVLVKANRNKAVREYAAVLLGVWPTWAASAKALKADNLISIGLYSGPSERVRGCRVVARWEEEPTWAPFLHWPVRRQPGWLGTGDAPLGETACWSDFRQHYSAELPNTSTVVIPHHGAAPVNGPRFYHAGLNAQPGMVSVISYGVGNSYGHPRTSVIAGILAGHGVLQRVTDANPLGFHEVVTGYL